MPSNPIKKILFLAANPQETDQLRLGKEVQQIEEALQLSKKRDYFEIKSEWAVTTKTLRRALLNREPHLIHFSGHGGGQQGLALEDDAGHLQLVSTESLTLLFKQFVSTVECVLLNACYSKVQAEAIAEYIPFVIGMNEAIGDGAAREFSVGFYDALGAGRTIEEAFEFGVNAIALEGIPDEDIPVLLKRDSWLAPKPKGDVSVVEMNGNFYVVRSQLERWCHEELGKAGALIRIKSPERMGKTWMRGRVLDYAQRQGYRQAVLDLQDAGEFFGDINQFLRWFCACVGDQLEIDQRPEDAWKGFLGANTNCTKYVDKFFLSGFDTPLIIAIDNFDRVFQHPHVEADFCGLLRGWFEKVNTSPVWGKLRQIIVYSQEPYATLNINQSPFNVGLPIDLGELAPQEVSALADSYGMGWTEMEISKLMEIVGGHPYLVQQAIDQIIHHSLQLDQLLNTAPTEAGIYKNHLNECLQKLEKNPDLREAMQKVVNSDCPVYLSANIGFKLDSMGLTKPESNDRIPRCGLYRLYFKDRLR